MNEVKINKDLFIDILSMKLSSLFSKTIESLTEEELKKISPVAEWGSKLCTDEEHEKARAIVREKIVQTKKQVLYDTSPALYNIEKTVCYNHSIMVQEVTERINAHRNEISRSLLNGRAFTEVTHISGDGADVHNHGRLTLTITTPEGKFLYKPRSCKTDEVLSELITSHFSDIVRVPRALDFGNYGFCEFINNRPAERKEEATAYYHNLGGVSALIHALGGTDFHCENFLADGRYPVPVDLETIITPTVRYFYEKGELPRFLYDYNHSIAQSSLLPKSSKHLQFSPLLCTTSKNAGAPVVDGVIQTVRGYETAFFVGFDAIYDRCMELKEQITSAVLRLKDSPIRKLIRNTASYAKVITHLNRPDSARNSEEQQKIFDSLSKYFLDNNLDHLIGIPQAEKASLSERDIPYFYTLGGSVDLYSDNVVAVKDYFKTSAVDNALERLNRLNSAEKQFEKSLISRALEYAIISKTPPCSFPDLRNAAPMAQEEALELSGKLLKKIHDASFLSPSGKRGFLGHVGDGDSLSCMQMQFSNGVGGICAFGFAAAALDSRWKSIAEDFAEIYQDYLDYYVQFFSDAELIPPERNDLGLASGAAGIIATLSCAERFMPELSLHNTVKDVCTLLDIMPLEQCSVPDVYSGLSGLILSLYRVRETVDVKRHVCRAADRLLELKTLACRDLTLWSTLPKMERGISGYGHGCGGVGLALLRAWEMTGDERYRSAAEDAYAFEHIAYSERIATWPDFRSSPIPDRSQNGICSGAPGIALCLQAAQKAAFPFADVDMERAVSALRRQPMNFRDILCCGNCSAAEALIALGLHDDAAALLGKIQKMAQINGDYSFMPPNMESFFVPNLFYGAAGLGYTLLRFAEPDRIPSIFID